MNPYAAPVVLRLLVAGLMPMSFLATPATFGMPSELRVGIAGHAFDHLSSIGDQAEAAAASGANIIYVTGLGGLGYSGLPAEEGMAQQRQATAAYILKARHQGIRLAIGYVCATSMVNLEAFDKHWPAALRAGLHTPPSAWRQQDQQGNPLPSWYGGQYQPACMNNPDWRAYEHFMVRQQLESGCDGIFFDNPTVHPQGCYCPHCMEQFARYLEHEHFKPAPGHGVADLRAFAAKHPQEFLGFRCTVARDFLADMRRYARTIKPGALMTANNSLNSADVLYSQCRNYGYNIYQMSQAEDFVVVEDMSSQPRSLPGGQTMEYGPTYQQLRAISHGKPLVAVNLAESDYHTAPNLVRLAMAEAAAHGASYLSWPTWPEKERARMIAGIQPQAQFLRQHADLLNDTQPRRDVLLFLPFRDWLKTTECKASGLAAALTRNNIQYEVICEDDLRAKTLHGAQVLLVTALSAFTAEEGKQLKKFRAAGGHVLTAEAPGWLDELKAALAKPTVVLQGPSTVRATVRDQRQRTLVHLLNLDVQRLSSFEDQVTSARNLHLVVRVPLRHVRSVRALTADEDSTSGMLRFAVTRQGEDSLVETWLPYLQLSTLLLVE